MKYNIAVGHRLLGNVQAARTRTRASSDLFRQLQRCGPICLNPLRIEADQFLPPRDAVGWIAERGSGTRQRAFVQSTRCAS